MNEENKLKAQQELVGYSTASMLRIVSNIIRDNQSVHLNLRWGIADKTQNLVEECSELLTKLTPPNLKRSTPLWILIEDIIDKWGLRIIKPMCSLLGINFCTNPYYKHVNDYLIKLVKEELSKIGNEELVIFISDLVESSQLDITEYFITRFALEDSIRELKNSAWDNIDDPIWTLIMEELEKLGEEG